MAAYLDEHDMPGAMHRGRFDDWYPGFVDHVNSFAMTVSFLLTETAVYRYATPHFYTVDEFTMRQIRPERRGCLSGARGVWGSGKVDGGRLS